MPWKYDDSSNLAVHIETNTTFGVRFSQNVKGPSDFELIPPSGSIRAWPPAKLDQIKRELWTVIEGIWHQKSLRLEMHNLIQTKLAGDNYQAAKVISKMTGKEVSARSIQAWLIEPTRKSSRTCPTWAVEALKQYSPPQYGTSGFTEQPRSWQVRNNAAVELAERSIDADKRRRKKWAQAGLNAIPDMLSTLEKSHDEYLKHLHGMVLAINAALRASNSFEDFKQRALDELEEVSSIESSIFEAKRDIELGQGEFSNAEGLKPSGGAQS